MSSVVIAGNTSGSVTLDAPAVAGTTVLTLPATSGTVIVGTAGVTGTSSGGTGLSSFTSGGAMYATSTSALTTGTLPVASGGTGSTTAAAAFNALNPMTTVGDIIYEGAGPAAARLGIGSEGQFLSVASGVPAWATVSTTPTTAQVLTATAGATAGAVGTYAMLGNNGSVGSAAITVGSNYAGSEYTFIGFRRALGEWSASATDTVQSGFAGGTGSGTWKAMGQYNSSAGRAGTLFLRVA